MTTSLYDADFDAWAQQQASALRAKDWAALDIEHLAEEVEELRKTERRGVRSQLRLILSHLLKWVYQPDKRTDSRRSTIANGRVLVQADLEDSPSLARELPVLVAWAYPRPGQPLPRTGRGEILAKLGDSNAAGVELQRAFTLVEQVSSPTLLYPIAYEPGQGHIDAHHHCPPAARGSSAHGDGCDFPQLGQHFLGEELDALLGLGMRHES